MRGALTLLTTVLFLGFAPAQEHSLRHTVEAPLLYLATTAAPSAPGVAAADSPVRRLLAAPALEELLTSGAGADTPGRSALRFLRGVLERTDGEMELALTGILPVASASGAAGQPLMVFRARLTDDGASRMRAILESGALARANRRLGDHQVFLLSGVSRDEPGGQVEVVVAGRDLLVANGAASLEEALGVSTRPGDARVLLRDEGFLDLQRRLSVVPGSMIAYADGARLGGRLARMAKGLPQSVWLWSGLAEARRVMAAVEPRDGGLATTLLFELDSGTVDGWLELTRPTPARTLLASLPPGGVGGLVVALEPAELFRRAELRGGSMCRGLTQGCQSMGLDFDRQIVDRLGKSGALQLLLLSDADAHLQPVWSLRAKSKKAARDLFADAAEALTERGLGRLHEAARGDVAQLSITGFGDSQESPRLAAVDGSLVLGFHPEITGQLLAESRRTTRAVRAQRDDMVQESLAALGADRRRVSGLLAFDLRSLLDQLGRSIDAEGRVFDSGALPARHAGCLDVETTDEGRLVRIQLFSRH